jgi:hypothetical protein
MTLRVVPATDESVELVGSRLAGLAARTAYRDRALTRADPAALALAVPHDVYTVRLRDLAEGTSLDAATVVGRRFLVMEGDRPIAAAELADQETGTGFQLNEGPYVEATADAIEHAESDPDLAGDDYEVRLLRIPAVYFTGLWLRSEQPDADVVIPLDPAPAPLEGGRKYGASEILSALGELARARLAADDDREP